MAKRRMKPGNIAAMDSLSDVRLRAEDYGIRIVVTRFGRRKRRKTLHVMFNSGPQRLADYWPATGCVISVGEKMTVMSLDAALAVAIDADGRLDERVSGRESWVLDAERFLSARE